MTLDSSLRSNLFPRSFLALAGFLLLHEIQLEHDPEALLLFSEGDTATLEKEGCSAYFVEN